MIRACAISSAKKSQNPCATKPTRTGSYRTGSSLASWLLRLADPRTAGSGARRARAVRREGASTPAPELRRAPAPAAAAGVPLASLPCCCYIGHAYSLKTRYMGRRALEALYSVSRCLSVDIVLQCGLTMRYIGKRVFKYASYFDAI